MSEHTTTSTVPEPPPAPVAAALPAVEPAAAPGVLGRLRGAARFAQRFSSIGLVLVLGILFLVGMGTSPNFATSDNILNILTSASVIGVISVGMTFVIIGGGIDLSVGAIVALASVWATTASVQSHGFWMMIGVTLLVAVVTGMVNGLFIAYGQVVPFIMTLAMLASARGLAERISNRQSQIVNVPSFADIAFNKILGIPLLVYIFAGAVALGWVLLNLTTFGRRTYAIGGNPEAARLAGINVRRHTVMLYMLSGLACGIAAIMLTARTNVGASTHGTLYELDAIAAVIIGGTLITGGRGSLLGSVLGVLVFTTITNIFILNNLQTDIQEISKGIIIVAAVLLQRRSNQGAPG